MSFGDFQIPATSLLNTRSVLKKLLLTIVMLFLPAFLQAQDVYFPPPSNAEWETSHPALLGWDTEKLDEIIQWLGENETRAFIILKDGKIVVEHYYQNFSRQTPWYWASAGKTVTAYLIGVLAMEGLIDIHSPVSDYLGRGWTSMPSEKENLITVWHQLTMTTGLDYTVDDLSCTLPECLKYRSDAGEQWFYHNAPYTLLTNVIESATGQELNDFLDSRSEDIPGFSASYADGLLSEFNRVVFSRALDMARFGLFISQNASWDGAASTLSAEFYQDMLTPSQELNPSYGYLWWLNGQDSYIPPVFPVSFDGPLSSSAPSDMVSALGLNSQILSIVPSEELVVVRMGADPGSLFDFNDEKWERLSAVLNLSTNVEQEAPSGFRLYQNFPNPFNPSTVISFEVPELTHVRLDVFDAAGRHVAKLLDEGRSAGTHQVSFNASGLSSGIYYYRLRAGDYNMDRKMVLLK